MQEVDKTKCWTFIKYLSREIDFISSPISKGKIAIVNIPNFNIQRPNNDTDRYNQYITVVLYVKMT